MKPFYTKVTEDYDYAITVRYDEQDILYPDWHYHDEYELVYVHKGKGVRYIGDDIRPYQVGDMVLLGSRLPHVWMNRNEKKEYSPSAMTVIHFKPQFVRNSFFELSMMQRLKTLFERSSRGLCFKNIEGVEPLLEEVKNTHEERRVLAVLHLLIHLLKHEEVEEVSSSIYHTVLENQQSDRLLKIHNYIAKHFREKIELEQLASLIPMTVPAFCAYFKKQSRKTVMDYISDLRIGYSCKLLVERNSTVEQVALQSGFNSTTFYNRKFKEKMGMTPKAYRKAHLIDY